MQTMDRVTELSILYEISGLPTRLKDLDEIARRATDKAVRLLGGDVAICYLYQPTPKVLHPQGARGVRVQRLSDLLWAELDPAVAQAIEEKRPLAWSGEDGEAPNLLGPRYPVKAALVAPMRSDETLLGLLYVVRLKARPFTVAEQTLYGVLADRVANAIENAHSFQLLERRVGELQTLNQVGQVLARSLDIEELLVNLHAQVGAVLDAESFFVTLLDEATDEWETLLTLERGVRQPPERHARHTGLTGHIMQTGEPLLLATQAEIEGFFQARGIEQIGEMAKSWMGVPMLAGEQVVGVMAVQSYAYEYRYDTHHVALLSTITSHAAVAIHNARLFQAVEEARQKQLRQAQQLEALHRLTLALSEKQHDLHTVMELLTERAMELLACDGVELWLKHDHDTMLELVYEKRLDGLSRVGRLLQPGDGLVGRAYVESRILVVDDYAHWEGRAKAFTDVPFISALAAPLVWQEETVGVLNFSRSEQQAFVAEEHYLAELLVAQAAAVLQNTRLFAQTQAALREMEATQRRYQQRVWAEYLSIAPATRYEARQEEAAELGVRVLPEVQQVLARQAPLVLTGAEAPEGHAVLAAPSSLRGGIVGVLGIHDTDAERVWTEDQIALVEAVAERMALAADNLRLLDATQRRAAREQLTREITDKMRRAVSMEDLIETAAREVAAAFGAPESFVQLKPTGTLATQAAPASASRREET